MTELTPGNRNHGSRSPRVALAHSSIRGHRFLTGAAGIPHECAGATGRSPLLSATGYGPTPNRARHSIHSIHFSSL